MKFENKNSKHLHWFFFCFGSEVSNIISEIITTRNERNVLSAIKYLYWVTFCVFKRLSLYNMIVHCFYGFNYVIMYVIIV